jgi:hypothetical protein
MSSAVLDRQIFQPLLTFSINFERSPILRITRFRLQTMYALFVYFDWNIFNQVTETSRLSSETSTSELFFVPNNFMVLLVFGTSRFLCTIKTNGEV